MRVQDLLESSGVAYDVVPHEQAYTAQEVAAAEHVTGHMFAKTVIVRAGENVCMLVLPASRHVDFNRVDDLLGARPEMVSEEEMRTLFPDCEIGAEAPFGSQYGIATYVDESVTGLDEIMFRAGRHDETVRMAYADYEEIEQPIVARFAAGPD